MHSVAGLSAKHQQFVNRIIAGDSATLAYCTAYGCTEAVGAANGSRLLKNAKVAVELAKRLQKAAEKADLTLTDHLAKLAELRDLASGKDQYSAATSAEISRGRASGFYVERKEHTGKNGGPIEVRVRVAREGKRVTAA